MMITEQEYTDNGGKPWARAVIDGLSAAEVAAEEAEAERLAELHDCLQHAREFAKWLNLRWSSDFGIDAEEVDGRIILIDDMGLIDGCVVYRANGEFHCTSPKSGFDQVVAENHKVFVLLGKEGAL